MATQQEILEAQQYLAQLKGSQLNQDPNRDWAAFDDYTTKLEAENRLAEQAAKPKETIFDKLKNVSSSFLTKGLGTVNPLIGLLSQSGTVQKAVGDFALGAAKTVPGTALGALGLVDVATKKLGGTPISEMTTPEEKSLEQTISKPEGGAQQAGYAAGEIAQFLMPVPGLEKAKAAGLIPRIATEAAEAGLKTAVQKGDVDKDVKTNALIAAAFPALGAGLKSVAPLASPTLKAVGEKIQNVIVKPNAKDIEKGFNVENIKKYDLGGTLSEMFEKVNKRLNEYWGELQTKLQSAKNKGANVDLFEIFYKTLDDLKKSKGKDFGDLNAIKRVTDNLASEIDEVSNKTGIVDILEAQNVKQGAGTKGAWVFGSADPDASAKEIVYDIFYFNLRKQIDETAAQVGDEGINEINKKLSEIIPIKSALIRRMPVEERNQVLGLISNMSLLGSLFNPKALALFGVDKLLKSGRFADFLLKASENAKNLKNVTGEAGSPVSRVFGGSVENPSSFGLGIEDVSKKPGFKSPAVGETADKGGYLYHGTNEDVLENISKEGLKPGKRGQLSLSKDEAYAKSFAREGMTPQGKTNPVLFRVKSDLLEGKTTLNRVDGKPRPMSDQLNEVLTKETISPENLEIYKDGKWQPLKEEPLIQEAKKYNSAEEFVKARTKQEYRSTHQLSLSDSITADKIDIPTLKEAIRTRNGYLNKYNLSDLKKLEKLQNNPDADVTIYRASPKNEINEGDWVTTDKIYANYIKKQNGGKVYSYTVKVKDLRFPKDTETLPSLSMASTFSYSPKTPQLLDIWNKAHKKTTL